MKKILILSPHTDDSAFGLGATIAKWHRQGHIILDVAFSHVGREDLKQEFERSCEMFDIKGKCLDFPVRNFTAKRQEILDKMIRLKEEYNPGLVVVPCSYDTHQDHHTIYEESLRAFKTHTIIGFEQIWNTYQMTYDIISEVRSEDIDIQWDAIRCYKSQEFRMYFDKDKIVSQASTCGGRIGVQYAEAMEAIRIIERDCL